MKRIVCMMALSFMGLSAIAQQDTTSWKPFTLNPEVQQERKSGYTPVTQYGKKQNIFNHLDVSLTLGTTGIGIDAATPIGDYVQLRAGYEFMPRFTKRMSFDLTINGKSAKAYDKDGNRQETTYDRMSEFLYEFTGFDIDDHVDMIGKPTMNNFKMLVDVFPFKNNKHWHFTAGFYWGPSRFAYAENSVEAMTTLMSVSIYNSMYDKALKDEPLFDIKTITGKDISFNIEAQDAIYEKLLKMGRLGFAVGTFKHDVTDNHGVVHHAGEKYIMEPDEQNMVRVNAKSNAFKPYVGFGYGGNLIKGRDDLKVSFDCGALIWGHTSLKTHDGIDLAEDLEKVNGQISTYVDIFKAFKVYPVLSLRLTKTIF